MHLSLTPGQAVSLHGWGSPRLILRWTDVVEKETITFRRCREAQLSLKQLHQLQPDAREWVRHGGANLLHALDMSEVWDVNPLRDFRADLADLLSMRWGSETLRRMGVTYEELVTAGMTPETMRMFGFSMLGWINLGLRRDDLDAFTDAQVSAVFALPRAATEAVLPRRYLGCIASEGGVSEEGSARRRGCLVSDFI